jgi:hypothetical protein
LTVASRAGLLAAIVLGVGLAPAPPGLPSPASAQATPSATLSAAFTPDRLAQRTTLSFGFRISAGAGVLPPAMTEADLSYPGDLGIALSGLGLATCTEATLQALGPGSCPANSIMGYGEALTEIALGPNIVGETSPLTILRAPDREGHIGLLFYATGTAPIEARAVFAGALLPAPPPFGGTVSIAVPPTPSLPGAPDVALVQLHATLGPSGVTYFEEAAHQTLAYRPTGILLPNSCPRGGFPFAAELSFVDGSRASAHAAVPCPRRRRSAVRRRRAR